MRTSAVTCDRCGTSETIDWRTATLPEGWETKWTKIELQEQVELCPPCAEGYEQVRDEIEAHIHGRLAAYITNTTQETGQ